MPFLDLPATTARMQTAAAAGAAAEAAAADSVTIDIGAPVDAAPAGAEGASVGDDGAPAVETCTSEMSFCDLAESVAPSDSASQVFSPRKRGSNFAFLNATIFPADEAFSAWQQQCAHVEDADRVQAQQDQLVQRLLQEHAAAQEGSRESREAARLTDAADAADEESMRLLVQSVRNIERSLVSLHLHFGTDFPGGRGLARRACALPKNRAAPEAPQSFQSNTNVNAPNMNRQHSTGGRGRGRRHAQP